MKKTHPSEGAGVPRPTRRSQRIHDRAIGQPALRQTAPLPSGPLTRESIIRSQVRRYGVPQRNPTPEFAASEIPLRSTQQEAVRHDLPAFVEPMFGGSGTVQSDEQREIPSARLPSIAEEKPSTSKYLISQSPREPSFGLCSPHLDWNVEEVDIKYEDFEDSLEKIEAETSSDSDPDEEEQTSTDSDHEEQEEEMAATPPMQTIPITANIQPFQGQIQEGELHFQQGCDVRTWIQSVYAYYQAAGITQDAEKIARVATLVDRSCGDAATVVARMAAEFSGKSWAALCEALISHYADFRVHDPITQIETFMNNRPPVKNAQQIPMLFLKAREKVP